MANKKVLLVCCLIPLTAYADEKADIAIKVDLIKADLALSQHNLNEAVNALSDATKYLPDAGDEVVHRMAAMNERLEQEIRTPLVNAKPRFKSFPGSVVPVPSETKPLPPRRYNTAKSLGYRDPKLWPYPGGVSAAVRPNEHIKEYPVPFVPNTAKLAPTTDHLLGWYAQDANGHWVWLSEAPPVEEKQSTLKQLLTTPDNKDWNSVPFPH